MERGPRRGQRRDGERGNAGVSLPAGGRQAADAGRPDGTRGDGQSPRGTVSGGRTRLRGERAFTGGQDPTTGCPVAYGNEN